MSYPLCEDAGDIRMNLRFTIYDLRVANGGDAGCVLRLNGAVVGQAGPEKKDTSHPNPLL